LGNRSLSSLLPLSAEMDGKLDGTLLSLLRSKDVSLRQLQGIQFKNVSLTVQNPLRGIRIHLPGYSHSLIVCNSSLLK
jgi:hypothetical protein